MTSELRTVSWYALEGMIRPALAQARLEEAQLAALLKGHGVERVEDLPADKAHDFVAALVEASSYPVFAPPRGVGE